MGNQCRLLFGTSFLPLADVTSERHGPKIKKSGFDYSKVPNVQTVFTVGRTKTHIILRKLKSQHWYSEKVMHDGADTPQGDPRALVLIAGTKIGRFLGFKLSEGADYVELHVPQIHYFKSKLDQINILLTKNHLPPLIFNLLKMGIASDRTIVGLSTLKKGSNEFHFPFDDVDPNLLIHEYSYHLGALFLPASIARRASQVSDRLLEFIKSIEKRPGLQEVSRILLSERSVQLDAGTAGISVALMSMKYEYPNLSFREMLGLIGEMQFDKDLKTLENALQILAQSSTTPASSVLLHAYVWLGLGRDLISEATGLQNISSADPAKIFNHERPKFSEPQRKFLETALAGFIAKYAQENPDFDVEGSNRQFADPIHFLQTLDQRLHEIESVLPK